MVVVNEFNFITNEVTINLYFVHWNIGFWMICIVETLSQDKSVSYD